MITAPAQDLTGTHPSHRTLFVIVLASLAVVAAVIVLLATSPWSSNSTSGNSPGPKPAPTSHVAAQCFGGRVIHPC
jgi:hypothetical protein